MEVILVNWVNFCIILCILRVWDRLLVGFYYYVVYDYREYLWYWEGGVYIEDNENINEFMELYRVIIYLIIKV